MIEQLLHEATTAQRDSRSNPLAGGYGKGGLGADNNNLGQQVMDELDASLVQRNRVDARNRNPNTTGPQKLRDREQLQTLGRTREEQDIIDEAERVLHGADKAQDTNQLALGESYG